MKYIIPSIALLAVFTIACSREPTANVATNGPVNVSRPTTSPLPSATIDELASGRKIYEANCTGCHKEDGSGGPMEIEGRKIKPDDLTSAKIKAFSDEKTLGYIMNGVEDEGMPAFKGKLSEAEMRDVVRYIRIEIQKMPAGQAPPKS